MSNEPNELAKLDNDIWVNLLSPGSMEELGKVVYKKLMEARSNDYTHSRKIVVCGS